MTDFSRGSRGIRTGFFRLFLPVLAAAACAVFLEISPAPAAESYIAPPMSAKENADSVEATIDQRNALDYDPNKHSLFPDYYYKFRDWREGIYRKMGLQATMSYSMLGQQLISQEERQGASAGDVTFAARWLLMGAKYNKPFHLNFRVRHRHKYAELSPNELGPSHDLLWKTTAGYTDAGFQIPDFYFSQELFDGKLTLRYGQFGIDNFVDNHNLRSAKRFFLNQAFSKNPTVGFPSYGAGGALLWQDPHNWDVALGVSNIQSTDAVDTEYINLSLGSSALFYTMQGGYNFAGLGGRDSRVQIMAWKTEKSTEDELNSGSGVSMTLEHQGAAPTERYVIRAASSEGDASLVDRLLMFGYGREMNKFDHYGMGLGIGRSAENNNRWQGVAEAYYRWQATKELLITPDLQVIFGQGTVSGESIRIVAGIRAGFTF